MRKFFDFISELPIRIKMIILILVIIVLAIFLNLINREETKTYTSTINYKTFNSSILDTGNYYQSYNREYLTVSSNIVSNFVNVFFTASHNGYTLDDYYEILDDNYKKNISKKKFKEKFLEVYDYVIYGNLDSVDENNTEEHDGGENVQLYTNIYRSTADKSYFLVEFYSDEHYKGYIGIHFDTEKNRFYIYYLGY